MPKAKKVAETEKKAPSGDDLLSAARKGDSKAVSALLKAGAPVNHADEEGFTPLLAAAGARKLAVVQALLAHGADPAMSNTWGMEPLYLAATTVPPDLPIIKALMDAGASVHAETEDGETPLEYLEEAIRQGDKGSEALSEYLASKGVSLPGVEDNSAAIKAHSALLAALGKGPTLSTAQKLLRAHFKPWLSTSACEATFEFIIARLKKWVVSRNSLTLHFAGDDGPLRATFGPPAKALGGGVLDLDRLHSSVVGDPKAGGFSVFYPGHGFDPGDEDEEIASRFSEFCDAGQNWIVWDSKRRSSLGEPMLCLWDHGARLRDATPYPGQTKNAYGAPGLLLRLLAHRLATKNPQFAGFGYG